MKFYCFNLKFKNSFSTPFQADTFFGHLCWTLTYTQGKDKLKKFLEPFRAGEPPFLISDGFPSGLLPKPLTVELTLVDPEQRKNVKKLEWVKISDFEKLRQGITPAELEIRIREDPLQITTVHNTINQLTNTVLSEGGLYTLSESILSAVSIYLKTIDEGWKIK